MMKLASSFLLGFAATTTITTTIPVVEAAEGAALMAQKQRLVEWLLEHPDAYMSDKISLTPGGDNDISTVVGGIHAVQDIAKGERLFYIPQDKLIQPPEQSRDQSICRTAKLLADEYWRGRGGGSGSDDQEAEDAASSSSSPSLSEYWPYIEYVFESYPHEELPTNWSDDGIRLVLEIIGDGYLEPSYFGQFKPCKRYYRRGVSDYNRLLDAARRIVDSRGWNQVLVPVLDMGNHRNGHWHNMDQSRDSKSHDDFEVVALRDITAGEQLYLSYNQCPDYTCRDVEELYVTPELFQDYGFVEQYPQLWYFYMGEHDRDDDEYTEDNDYVLFELDLVDSPGKNHVNNRTVWIPPQNDNNDNHDNTNTDNGPDQEVLQLKWLRENGNEHDQEGDIQSPDEEQLEWLRVHVQRLHGLHALVYYEAQYLPTHERDSAVAYYHAITQAMEYAVRAGTDLLAMVEETEESEDEQQSPPPKDTMKEDETLQVG